MFEEEKITFNSCKNTIIILLTSDNFLRYDPKSPKRTQVGLRDHRSRQFYQKNRNIWKIGKHQPMNKRFTYKQNFLVVKF
jgi:hypothetical protein